MSPPLIPILLASLYPLLALSEVAKIDPTSDWPWWRGPSRDNKTPAGAAPPVDFSPSDNVIWKTPVPGRGHASPSVVGKRIFLATGFDDTEGQAVVAFDRMTGAQLWQREVNRGGFPPKIHAKNTHASSTVASDGKRVFAVFYNHKSVHVAALTVEGQPLWEKHLRPFEPKKYEFGYAASPLVYEEAVIVIGDQEENGFLVALDRKSGERLWRTDRPGHINYASPTLATIQGQDQILLGGCQSIMAYAPKSGALLWEAPGAAPPQTGGTVVWDGDLVFASGGYPTNMTTAVRAGSGEIVWQNNRKCYEQSMLAHDGYLYSVVDNGIAYCWRAEDGEEMWSERLKGPISASPVLAGNRIYTVNERGAYAIFQVNPKTFELLAQNQLGDEAFATPTIVGDRIYARVAVTDDDGNRQEILYCLGE